MEGISGFSALVKKILAIGIGYVQIQSKYIEDIEKMVLTSSLNFE